MRRLCRLVAILLVLSCVPGCWDLLEVDRRALATTIGIDGDDRRATVTLHIPQPQKLLPQATGGSTQGRTFNVVTVSAGSVSEALDQLQTRTFRELVLHQYKSIIIGEKAARNGVTGLLDRLIRDPGAPTQALVFVAGGSTAREVLSFTPMEQTLPGIQFFTMGQIAAKHNRTQMIPLWLFQQKLHHATKDPYAALVYKDEKQGTYVVSGIAVFDGDRMAGTLNAAETVSFGLIANRVSAGGASFENINGAKVTVRNLESRTRIRVRPSGTLPHFTVDVKVKGSISGLMNGKTLDQRYIRSLQTEMAKVLRRRFVRVIRKLQKLNSDIVDFGEQLRIQQPALSKRLDWKKAFPETPFQVNVHVQLLGDGALK